MDKKLNFLIIDDIETLRVATSNMLKNMLRAKNIEADVMVSENAENGLADICIYADTLDAIFMAWNLPDINGAELLNMIRENEDFNHIKIIITASEKYKEDVKQNRRKGVHGYLIKPYTQKDISKVLSQIAR